VYVRLYLSAKFFQMNILKYVVKYGGRR